MRMVTSVTFTSGRELIEAERRRLMQARIDSPDWWQDENRSNWARREFGPNLIEKDGSILNTGEPFYEHQCSICGRLPGLDERIIRLMYPCDENEQEINICRGCAGFMSKAMEAGK